MSTKNVIVHGDSRLTIPTISTPISCVITDPPYGMDFSSNQATSPHGKEFTAKIEGDDNVVEAVETFQSIMGAILPKMKPDADIYVFTAWHVVEHWLEACRNLAFVYPNPYPEQPELAGTLADAWIWDAAKNRYVPFKGTKPIWKIEVKMMLIWAKGDPGMGDLAANWGCGHEVCIYVKLGRRPVPKRRQGVLTFDKVPTGKNIHPTEKPVGLLKELIEMSTEPGDLVVDPYSGSGSTAYAAMLTGRNSLSFEIDAKWIPDSRARLQQIGLFAGD